jgi:hypothetical protein
MRSPYTKAEVSYQNSAFFFQFHVKATYASQFRTKLCYSRHPGTAGTGYAGALARQPLRSRWYFSNTRESTRSFILHALRVAARSGEAPAFLSTESFVFVSSLKLRHHRLYHDCVSTLFFSISCWDPIKHKIFKFFTKKINIAALLCFIFWGTQV